MNNAYEWSAEIMGFPHRGPGLMGAKRRLERAAEHHVELLSLVEDFEDLNLGADVKVRVSIAGG